MRTLMKRLACIAMGVFGCYGGVVLFIFTCKEVADEVTGPKVLGEWVGAGIFFACSIALVVLFGGLTLLGIFGKAEKLPRVGLE